MKIRGNTVGTTMSPQRIGDRIGGTGGSADGAVLYTPQTLTEEQREQARQNIDVPSYYEFEAARDDIRINKTAIEELHQGYRHIRTETVTADDGVPQIDTTKDKYGNAFSCSDFLIFITLPKSNDSAKTQLYIGHQMYNWDAFIPGGFSATVTRRMRIHLYHAFDGYWLTDGVFTSNESYTDMYVDRMGSYENTTFGTIMGKQTTQNPATELHFLAQNVFGKGTIIEIYGK